MDLSNFEELTEGKQMEFHIITQVFLSENSFIHSFIYSFILFLTVISQLLILDIGHKVIYVFPTRIYLRWWGQKAFGCSTAGMAMTVYETVLETRSGG